MPELEIVTELRKIKESYKRLIDLTIPGSPYNRAFVQEFNLIDKTLFKFVMAENQLKKEKP